MPTPEPAPGSEPTDAPDTPRTDTADPWERMPEGALNRPELAERGPGTGAPAKEAGKPGEGGGDDAEDSGPGDGGEDGERSGGVFDFLPSPVFVLVLGLTVFAGWLSWRAVELDWAPEGTNVTPLLPPLFILLGWIVSCAVHEYAHALAAHLAGDRSQRGGAYLRLNPFGFRHAFAGTVLPVLYLGFGAFGLNGPPAFVAWDRIPRGRRAMVALAGPLASLVLAAALAVTVSVLVPPGNDTTNWAIAGLAFLAFLNLTSALVNLLPVPGLDGFEVLAAALPERRWVSAARVNALFGSVAVFAVLWFPALRDLWVGAVYTLFRTVMPNPTFEGTVFLGELLLQFWNA
ncbi:site-2 protease family protein [Nocardiopsis changdeensis]|uniref:Site-2 protease family protein n=1 Tax=Nocardiopsis changdeensis TaxID=2831969 RepID=A0ABX8BN86_9ACTN|nr:MULTISPECIES: site-2 protease family protein [Nocardiopsis]QUX23704.1 site-2 protease family protein [Nocardiopsis changdeensis]QYX39648.1 site-2 protease family protein [Nocardiopsis sp. MT53]